MFTCHRCDIEQKEEECAGQNRGGRAICEACFSLHGYYYADCCDCVVINYDHNLGLCSGCADDYRYCADCGYVGNTEYGECHWSENRDEWLCESCYLESEYLPGVREYHAGAPWGLSPIGGEFGKHVFLGVEFEMVGHNDPSDILDRLESKRYAHAESDSSLSCGLELISQPATLDAWRGVFGEHMRRALDALQRRGFDMGDEDCGAHVHISRTAFTDAQHLARFSMWFQHNASDHGYDGAPEMISGRGYSDYARTDVWHRGELAQACKGRGGYARRMSAVNLTNTTTVEVRIWAGTNDFAETLGSLETVVALVEMTRDLTAGDCMAGGLHADTFAHFLESNCDRYRHAVALWESRIGF